MVGTVHTAFRQCQHYTHQIADISRDSSRITVGAFQARSFVRSIVLTLVLVLVAIVQQKPGARYNSGLRCKIRER
jgi:hypothetical protein